AAGMREPDAEQRLPSVTKHARPAQEVPGSQVQADAQAHPRTPGWLPDQGAPQEGEEAKAGESGGGGGSERERKSITSDLLGAFAPWRTDPNWSPPPLPRFGPPTAAGDEESEPAADEAAFEDDEFLR